MKRLLSWSSFEHEDDRRTARALVWLILASWGLYLLVAVVSWYFDDWRTIVAMGAACLLQLVPAWLIGRGRLRSSAFSFLLIVLVAVTAMATFGQGIRDIGVIAYPIVFVFAGLTLSRRTFGLFVVLTLAAVGWLAIGEVGRVFVPSPLTVSVGVYLTGVVAVLLVGAFAVYLLATNMRRSLAYARRELAQRMQAEQALLESEERFRFLSSMTSEGIMVHENGVVLDANQAFAELVGCSSPTELIGDDGLARAPFTSGSEERIRAHMHESVSDTYEIELTLPDGSQRFAETNCRAITYRGRQARLVSMRDITEHKQAEEALQASEEQLRQSQKMEAVGQLAGGIAHDFNNLLSAILGYADLLLAGSDLADKPARDDLEEIKHAAERASALTKQILAFSRRQALRPTVVSLNDVLDRMEPLLRRTLGEDIDLVTLKDPDLGTVEADVHQLEQVIMNLAVNARDAMPTGGRLVMETANAELGEEFRDVCPESAPGSHIVLQVTDTGVGMDEGTRIRVFEPFFTTKASGAGSGLGLAVAYGIVKQSSGGILVESEPDAGTTFTIYLPRASDLVNDEAPVDADVADARGTETILLVEDETSVRNLAARVLQNLGYRVIAVGTVSEAQRMAEQCEGPLDLLLTDVVLPGHVQGNELARDLLASRPDLPVLYVSGYSRDALMHSGRLEKGVHLLEKPFTPDLLATSVRTVLDRHCRSE